MPGSAWPSSGCGKCCPHPVLLLSFQSVLDMKASLVSPAFPVLEPPSALWLAFEWAWVWEDHGTCGEAEGRKGAVFLSEKLGP